LHFQNKKKPFFFLNWKSTNQSVTDMKAIKSDSIISTNNNGTTDWFKDFYNYYDTGRSQAKEQTARMIEQNKNDLYFGPEPPQKEETQEETPIIKNPSDNVNIEHFCICPLIGPMMKSCISAARVGRSDGRYCQTHHK
jgi:hypothetical protein